MGNQRYLNSQGGFSQYLYSSVSDAVIINGVKGHLVEYIDKSNRPNWDLPPYSNTSDIYFRKNEIGEVSQAKVYLSREMVMDFDWDHHHRNRSKGEFFPKGTVHVQIYKKNNDGKFVRLTLRTRLGG